MALTKYEVIQTKIEVNVHLIAWKPNVLQSESLHAGDPD
jgi:hypothetical protein